MSVKIEQKNPGWLERLKKRYKDNKVLAIGYPKGTSGTSTMYPDGQPVVLVAATNNFGSKSRGMPARPFMTLAAEPALKAVSPFQEKAVKSLNEGKTTKEKILDISGSIAVGIFQDTITQLSTPANAESTIKAKKSSNPLIDTGLMRQTLTYVVRDK